MKCFSPRCVTPPCSSRETLDPGVVPVGRLDLQGSLRPALPYFTPGELFCRLLRCMSLMLARNRHADAVAPCRLLGDQRTWLGTRLEV